MASEREELAGLALDLRGHLEWLRDCGAREVPAVPKAAAPAPAARPAEAGQGTSLRAAVRAAVGAPEQRARPVTPPPEPAAPTRPVQPVPAARPVPAAAPPAVQAVQAAPALAKPGPLPTVIRSLEEIRAELGDCQRCKLSGKRHNIVFGVGAPKAELVFVGEGPGEEEDRQGIPFVGAAGQLLSKMIGAMGFSRDQVYICNVVKCRPPNNRNPEPDEITACEPFLQAQLATVQPKVIVTLGKFAAQTLLRDSTSITRLRGNWREYCGIKLMPTFHPAYLLRDPTQKKVVWDDLQQVMKVFGKAPVPAKK